MGTGWVIGETLITGIGQGYMQTTPLQLCLMTAQLANGGYKIYPRITINENDETLEEIKLRIKKNYESEKETKDGFIPKKPHRAYKDDFKGWAHFLGVKQKDN